jgi:hypothetical protein
MMEETLKSSEFEVYPAVFLRSRDRSSTKSINVWKQNILVYQDLPSITGPSLPNIASGTTESLMLSRLSLAPRYEGEWPQRWQTLHKDHMAKVHKNQLEAYERWKYIFEHLSLKDDWHQVIIFYAMVYSHKGPRECMVHFNGDRVSVTANTTILTLTIIHPCRNHQLSKLHCTTNAKNLTGPLWEPSSPSSLVIFC